MPTTSEVRAEVANDKHNHNLEHGVNDPPEPTRSTSLPARKSARKNRALVLIYILCAAAIASVIVISLT